jgi:methionyl aminopeptidase
MIKPKTAEEIAAMREGGKMLATILLLMAKNSVPGITPKELAAMAGTELKKMGGHPETLGYQGFPDVICISVNNQVQHTIPDGRQLQRGDIVNYDFVVRYKGMVTDAGITVSVGKPTKDNQRLLNGTLLALEAGLAEVRDGCKVGDISSAIEKVLKAHKLGIVRELVGHGVGHEMHEEPEIPNYGLPSRGPVLRTGMTICIEPIANLGGDDIIGDQDGWTLWTADGSYSAQFEHTVLVTDTGYEILTKV